jgi:hypothetical protein
MRILLTGAGGTIGRGLVPQLESAGHQLVLSDLVRPDWLAAESPHEFHQLDVQAGVGLDRAGAGCDLLLHTPAWHGIHSAVRTEADFWRLNVDGTFWALQAVRSNDIRRVVFLSSQSWHARYDKYGFTKRIGEELLEYHRRNAGIGYVAVRPADLTPWGTDWPGKYGARLLYGGVDRLDVLSAVCSSVAFLEQQDDGLVLDAVRPNAFTAEQLAGWTDDPIGTAETIFPGSREVVDRFGLDISRRPSLTGDTGWQQIGYAPTHHFGTFVQEALSLGTDEALARICDY